MLRKLLFLLTVISILCTGCAALNKEIPKTEELVEVYDIIKNQCSNSNIKITEDVEKYIEDIDMTMLRELEGYRMVVADFGKYAEIWRVDICTEESGEFTYRNMQYQIPIYEGNGFILYQIPGSCEDYMIFEYQLQ